MSSNSAGKPWLTMIVKNESRIIERCLRSVKPHVSGYHIVDTGSSDDTREKIRAFFGSDFPGAVSDLEWKGFGPSKTAAVERARAAGAKHALMVDADEVLTFLAPIRAKDFRFPLGPKALDIHVGHPDGILTPQSRLLNLAFPWRYECVLHEYATDDSPAVPRPMVKGVCLVTNWDSARAVDPEKYHKDAALLEAELEREPEGPHAQRYAFYHAQSLRDSGQGEKALAAYLRRARMGGWVEEVFVAWYEAGRIARSQGQLDLASIYYIRAFEAFPERGGEALTQVASVLRQQKRFALACVYAERAMRIPFPEGARLFVDRSCYEWLALDEFAVSADHCGRKPESARVSKEMLEKRKLPERERKRVIENMAWARGLRGEKK